MTVRVAHRTDVGSVRTINEDSYLVFEPQDPLLQAGRGKLLLVADGMGGVAGGDKASRLVVKAAKEAFYDEEQDLKVSEALARAVQHANRVVYEYGRQNAAYHGLGSTCTAVALHGCHAHFGHVGDSRIYLIRDHRILQLTDDHSKIAQMIREGKIQPEEANGHPQSNVIVRWLGSQPVVKVDIPPHPLELKAGDRLMICSDGLTSHVSDVELLRMIDQRDPQQAVDRLVELAKSRGGSDNITIILSHVVQVISPQSARYRPAMVDGVAGRQLTQPLMANQREARRHNNKLVMLIAVAVVWMLGLTFYMIFDSTRRPDPVVTTVTPVTNSNAEGSSAGGSDNASGGQSAKETPKGPSLARSPGSALDDPDPPVRIPDPPKRRPPPVEDDTPNPEEDIIAADDGPGDDDNGGDDIGMDDAGDILDPAPEKIIEGALLRKAIIKVRNPRGPICDALRVKIAQKLGIPSDDVEAFVQGVARYQRDNGISPVGNPGPQTRTRLFGSDIKREVCKSR